jgi:NitT/TauT family transport system permease protein
MKLLRFIKKKTIWDYLLSAIPFVVMAGLYWYASIHNMAHLPTLSDMVEKVNEFVFIPNFRTGEYVLLNDTVISLHRLGVGLGLSSILGFLFGINMALFRTVELIFSPFLRFLGTIPSMAILSLLMVWFGTDEAVKVGLIFIATFFLISGNIYLTTKKIPLETKVKALTLGASKFDIAYRVVLPLILPAFINYVRIAIGPAIAALIVSEGTVAEAGLGFRIFMLARQFNMDGIIPYVLWIAFIGWFFDWLFGRLLAWKFQWYVRTTNIQGG